MSKYTIQRGLNIVLSFLSFELDVEHALDLSHLLVEGLWLHEVGTRFHSLGAHRVGERGGHVKSILVDQ